MKAGDAVVRCTSRRPLADPRHDLTLVFYDCEEIEAARNGLGRIERELPDWLAADLALLGEPTDGLVEAGCQGTLRVEVARHRPARALGPVVAGRQRHPPRPPRCCTGSPPTRPGASRSTAASTARACRRCRSPAGWRATSSPTSAWSPSTSGSPRTARVDAAAQHVREVFDGLRRDGHRRRARRAARPRRPGRAGVPRRHRHDARGPSSAGPTSPGSPRWASPRSTTAPATRTSRTRGRSTSTSHGSPEARRSSGVSSR